MCHDGRCHVCNAHGLDRGVFGWLCDACWGRVQAIMDRILGRGH